MGWFSDYAAAKAIDVDMNPRRSGMKPGDYVLVPHESGQMMWLEVTISLPVCMEGAVRSLPLPPGVSHGETRAFQQEDVEERVPAADVPRLIAGDFFRIKHHDPDPEFNAAWRDLSMARALTDHTSDPDDPTTIMVDENGDYRIDTAPDRAPIFISFSNGLTERALLAILADRLRLTLTNGAIVSNQILLNAIEAEIERMDRDGRIIRNEATEQ